MALMIWQKKIAKVANFNMNDIELINPYHSNIPIKNFSDLDERVNQYYDYIGDYDPRPPEFTNELTPRARLGDFRSTTRDIFYYISWLYDNDPQSVIDYGCGTNTFKKWFPNIFGIDFMNWPFNETDLITPDMNQFISEHQGAFDCGIAVNSTHFGNIDIVRENIIRCMTLIKPKGRFLFTINTLVVEQYSAGSEYYMKEANVNGIYNLVKDIPYNVLLLDAPELEVSFLNGLNGNIRFILEKD